jgi:hypothetical protein
LISFNDVKTIPGFITALIFCNGGIALAATDQGIWVIMDVMALIVLSYSVKRAGMIYIENNE